MYEGYCVQAGLRSALLKYETAEGMAGTGGSHVQEAILEVDSPGAYGMLRSEAGVHRVQRVPATESKGRTHTSAASVLVLPSIVAEGGADMGENSFNDPKSDYYVDPKDVNIDVMRASGAGGQHVNRTESAVRLTHTPTNTVVAMQESRSQLENREKAWRLLRSRIAQQRRDVREEELARLRRGAGAGKAGRENKVRTYNWGQQRVSDHRSGIDVRNLDDVMAGGEALERVMASVRAWMAEQEVLSLVAEDEGRTSTVTGIPMQDLQPRPPDISTAVKLLFPPLDTTKLHRRLSTMFNYATTRHCIEMSALPLLLLMIAGVAPSATTADSVDIVTTTHIQTATCPAHTSVSTTTSPLYPTPGELATYGGLPASSARQLPRAVFTNGCGDAITLSLSPVPTYTPRTFGYLPPITSLSSSSTQTGPILGPAMLNVTAAEMCITTWGGVQEDNSVVPGCGVIFDHLTTCYDSLAPWTDPYNTTQSTKFQACLCATNTTAPFTTDSLLWHNFNPMAYLALANFESWLATLNKGVTLTTPPLTGSITQLAALSAAFTTTPPLANLAYGASAPFDGTLAGVTPELMTQTITVQPSGTATGSASVKRLTMLVDWVATATATGSTAGSRYDPLSASASAASVAASDLQSALRSVSTIGQGGPSQQCHGKCPGS
ncbi:Peptide chain release factor 1, mitochondrial [Friedmanniomyces endolithicus]|nr:Peptide chain release factor 1, mitochondrial [Friedmanniomyces endolithicus]